MKQTGISHHFSNHLSVLHILIPVSFIYFLAIKGVFCNFLNRHTNMYTRSLHNANSLSAIFNQWRSGKNPQIFSQCIFIQLLHTFQLVQNFTLSEFTLCKDLVYLKLVFPNRSHINAVTYIIFLFSMYRISHKVNYNKALIHTKSVL